MMNALRLTDGFDLSLLDERVQQSTSDIQEKLEKHQSQGLIDYQNNVLVPTERGRQMLDSMLQDYLVDT